MAKLFNPEQAQLLKDAAKKKTGELLSEESAAVVKKLGDSIAETGSDVIKKLGDSVVENGSGLVKKVSDSLGENGVNVADKLGEAAGKATESAGELKALLEKQKAEIEETGYSEKAFDILQKTINAVASAPLVHVDRDEFLRKQFGSSPYIDKILEDGPQSVYTLDSIQRKAVDVIKNSTRKTTMASFAAGLMANPMTTIATASFDVTQFFGFALNLAQKIAYLYGEDELFSEIPEKGFAGDLVKKDGEAVPEVAQMKMIAWLGAMMGVSGAGGLVLHTSKAAGISIGKKVASQALTQTTWYPILKTVGSLLGFKITKKTVESVINNAVPVIGGFISGGMTYAAFNPMGQRLSDMFVKVLNGDFDIEMELNPDFALSLEEIKQELEEDFIDAEFEDVPEEPAKTEEKENTPKKTIKVVVKEGNDE